MCKDCGCSVGHTHETGAHSHEHVHTHADGTVHSHAHMHEAGVDHERDAHDHIHANAAISDAKTIEVMSKILSANDEEAAHNRAHLDEDKILCLNLMSSPGSGKTTLLEATIKSGKFKIGVIEGDLETNRDADRIIKAGAQAHQISTGETCHLDAFMVHEGLHHIDTKGLDLVFIENVGNLVCPAAFDVGAHLNVVLLSVPEGSDKIAKYPVIFRRADCVVITKTALLPHFDFDMDEVVREVHKFNPKADVIALDSKSGEGVEKWLKFLQYKKEFR